jgi:SAM-dependent methyltransferase
MQMPYTIYMDYDTFAPFYDSVMGDRRDVVNIIRRQIRAHHPSAKTILELGCGTGSIISSLSRHYTVSGIDQSANMLQLAQQKLPNSALIHGTIAGFELKTTFDVIICVFDTINHLTTFSDWQKLLRSTQNHLSTNGLFIFDMNTIGRMQALTAIPGYTQTFNGNTMNMQIDPISPTEVEWHITVEQPHPDGAIQVYEEHVREVSFPLTQVQTELSKHFTILDSFDSDQQQPTNASDRVYFVCRKI